MLRRVRVSIHLDTGAAESAAVFERDADVEASEREMLATQTRLYYGGRGGRRGWRGSGSGRRPRRDQLRPRGVGVGHGW
jgi:hypothetical protein